MTQKEFTMFKFGKILVEMITWPALLAFGWLMCGVFISFVLWENVLMLETPIMALRGLLAFGVLYGAVRAVLLVRAGKI